MFASLLYKALERLPSYQIFPLPDLPLAIPAHISPRSSPCPCPPPQRKAARPSLPCSKLEGLAELGAGSLRQAPPMGSCWLGRWGGSSNAAKGSLSHQLSLLSQQPCWVAQGSEPAGTRMRSALALKGEATAQASSQRLPVRADAPCMATLELKDCLQA